MNGFTRFAAICVAMSLPPAGCVDHSGNRPEDFEPNQPTDPGSNVFSCFLEAQYQVRLIDDFEFGAASGSWFANNEVCERCMALLSDQDELQGTPDAGAGDAPVDSVEELRDCRIRCELSQFPTIFDKPLPADFIPDGGRCGSEYALHLVADRLVDWGANMGATFSPAIDASEWDGVAFWARRAHHSRGTIRVELSDPFTNGTSPLEANADEQTFCNPDFEQDNMSEGCDRFGAYALVGPTWNLFTLPFGEMRQAGWGKRASRFDTSELRSVTFLFPAGTWDIWIDDVVLYKRHENE